MTVYSYAVWFSTLLRVILYTLHGVRPVVNCDLVDVYTSNPISLVKRGQKIDLRWHKALTPRERKMKGLPPSGGGGASGNSRGTGVKRRRTCAAAVAAATAFAIAVVSGKKKTLRKRFNRSSAVVVFVYLFACHSICSAAS